VFPLQGCDPCLNLAIDSRRSGLLLGEAGSQLHPSHQYITASLGCMQELFS
jgi:hypothetical protein